MQKTPNLQLNKIELTDSPPDITVLNANWDKIEGELYPTIDVATVPTGNQGFVKALLGGIANRIKAITGKTNWWDTPVTNIENLNTTVNAHTTQLTDYTTHKNTSVADTNGVHGFKVEAGIFTPSLVGGASGEAIYSSRTGVYQLIGNRVFFDIEIVISSKNTLSGDILLTGLPFAIASGAVVTREISAYKSIVFPVGYTQVGVYLYAGTNSMVILCSGNNVPIKVINKDNIGDNFEIRASGSYIKG